VKKKKKGTKKDIREFLQIRMNLKLSHYIFRFSVPVRKIAVFGGLARKNEVETEILVLVPYM